MGSFLYSLMLTQVTLLALLKPNDGNFEDLTIKDEGNRRCWGFQDKFGTHKDKFPWKPRAKCQINGTVADCSRLNLTNVPEGLPINITALILSHNKIEKIPRFALSRYHTLRCLDISSNNLSTLSNESFWNLSLLEYLYLGNNKLAINEISPSRDHQRRVQPGFLEPLKNLKVLNLSMNEQQCLDDMIPLLSSITKPNVTQLIMQNIVNPYMPCVMISKELTETLPRGLKTLVFSSNSVSVVQPEVIDSLPKTLTYLDISDNRLTFGSYLKNFSKLENLNVLKLNGGEISFDLPTSFPQDEGQVCTRFDQRSSSSVRSRSTTTNDALLQLPLHLDTVEIKFDGWSYSLTEFRINSNNSLTNLSLNGNNIPRLIGPLTGLEMLKQLDIVDCNINFISDHFFNKFPSLEKLNLSMNLFGSSTLRNKTIQIFKGLRNLKELDLSFTNIITIGPNAFQGLESLEKLWIQRNPIYYFTVNISSMTNLAFINFSYTEIPYLDISIIRALDSITRARNKTVTIDFSEAPLRCICVNLFFFDWLVTANVTLINSGGNKCVFADSSEKHMNDNFHEIREKLDVECRPKLALFIGISAATFVMLCVIIGSIIYRFRWKLRYIYYSAYIGLKAKEDHANKRNQFEYDVFISYVSDDQNFVMKTLYPKLQSRGLKIHVHCLHFVPGQLIASNIVNAIQSSRYTLVVLTRQLLDSVWCKFELQMANMEHVHTDRPVLVFLLMEELTKKELGTELLYHIQSSTYIKYPDATEHQNEQQMEIFWTKLAFDLKS